ncbi:MAG: hypothetical protein AB7D37_20700, partial [Desulfovibrio sp.]
SASRRIPTICSSEKRPFLMAPSLSSGVTFSSFKWSEKPRAGHLPDGDRPVQGLYLVVAETEKRWTMRTRNWQEIMAQLSIFFQERLKDYLC